MKITNQFQPKTTKLDWLWRILIAIVILGAGDNLHAQKITIENKIDLEFLNDTNKKGTSRSVLQNLAHNKSQNKVCYLSNKWRKADVYFMEDDLLVRNLPIRVDIKRNEIEFQQDGVLKAIASYRIKAIRFTDTKDVIISEKLIGVQNRGFYRVLLENNYSLLCKYDIKVKKANYNVALAVGNKDASYIKDEKYFVYRNHTLIKLEKSKKKLKQHFSKQKDIYNFIKNNKLNPHKEDQLIDLVNFINENKLEIN